MRAKSLTLGIVRRKNLFFMFNTKIPIFTFSHFLNILSILIILAILTSAPAVSSNPGVSQMTNFCPFRQPNSAVLIGTAVMYLVFDSLNGDETTALR